MILFSFISFIGCSLFSFTNTEIPSGSILQRWIDVEGGLLDHNFTFLQCKGSCHFELLIYPENKKEEVFKDVPGNQIICCDPKDFDCQTGFLYYNNKSQSIIHRIYQIDGTPIDEGEKNIPKPKKHEEKSEQNQNPKQINENAESQSIGEVIQPVSNSKKGQQKLQQKYPYSFMMDSERVMYSVVLANCGEQPFRVTGFITIHSEIGYMDLRLTLSKYFTTLLFIFGTVISILWFTTIKKKRPRLGINHYFFIGSSAFYASHFFFLSLVFWIWSIFGAHSTLLTLFASITRSGCLSGLLYSTITALQIPQEINIKNFASVVVLLAISSFVEISGIESISSRNTGRWLFGFGAVPFIDFLVLSITSVVITVIATKKAPEETSDDPKRKKMLLFYLISFAVYFALSSAITIVTLGSDDITKSSGTDFIGFLVSPIYMTCLLLINAKFWMEFNPNGWEAQGDNYMESDNDLGLIDNDNTVSIGPAQPSAIPEISVKKNDKKKKKKSDDGFDIDIDFSDSGEPLEIEEKID